MGRFDIATVVVTPSGFRVAPREGHSFRARRIVGHLVRMKEGAIRCRTECPDWSDLPEEDYHWEFNVYGDASEEILTDAPEPSGKFVDSTGSYTTTMTSLIIT